MSYVQVMVNSSSPGSADLLSAAVMSFVAKPLRSASVHVMICAFGAAKAIVRAGVVCARLHAIATSVPALSVSRKLFPSATSP